MLSFVPKKTFPVSFPLFGPHLETAMPTRCEDDKAEVI